MVYIDDMFLSADVEDYTNGNKVVRGKWCHLTADTTEELQEFARRLGLNPRWFQPARLVVDNEYTRAKCPERIGKPFPGSRDHYDVTERVRARAIRLGAIPVHMGCEGWRDRKKERAELETEPVLDGSQYGQ